jgi:hypothetical protein
MTQRRVQDRVSGRSTRVISSFWGSDYSAGLARQKDQFAFVSDFDFSTGKPWKRPGKKKIQETGFSASIDSLFSIKIGSLDLIAQVSGGTMSAYDVATE